MKIKNNLKKLREKYEVQIIDLAKLLNINRDNYFQYERGETELTSFMIIKLAHFYNTNVDYLLGRTDNPNPYPKRQ